MVAKFIEEAASLSADVVNPYVHRLELTMYDKSKVAFMTFTVVPFRILFMLILLVIAWALAKLGIGGLSIDCLYKRPLRGWRKNYLKPCIIFFLRFMFFVGGWHWVTIKGKRASPHEAPILTVAPHSSIFDVLPVILMGAPSVVAKAESEDTTFFGTLINYTQPVYVKRSDPQSRQNTIKEILGRSQSKDNWDQILIFPEGTCTNRSCLISFKSGAFYPGVPVQPVCIKYPNRLDTMSWTWEGPGAFKLLWLSLCQFQNYCEIEYLPVYTPDDREKADARLYAQNVRQLMAKALKVPVSPFAYDDLRHITWVESYNLPQTPALIKLAKLESRLKFDRPRDEEIVAYTVKLTAFPQKVTLEEMAKFLNQDVSESIRDVFEIMDQQKSGLIDLRIILLSLLIFNHKMDYQERLRHVFDLFSHLDYTIRKEEFTILAWILLGIPWPLSLTAFNKLDVDCTGKITFDQAQLALSKAPAKIYVRPTEQVCNPRSDLKQD